MPGSFLRAKATLCDAVGTYGLNDGSEAPVFLIEQKLPQCYNRKIPGRKSIMKLKIYRTDNTDPYENLAMEEHLTFSCEEDEVILFLWQNAHTVVIGKNQNPWRECSVERIKSDGVCLARRMSGGGAVYHDMGNLNFTFIARDGIYDITRQTDVILLACRLMGINAEKNGRNDLTVEGRKFSGHAYYSSKGYNYHHGTIMMNVSGEDMPKYLMVSESKLKSKGVSSVRSRVTNLMDQIPEDRLTEICGAEETSEKVRTERAVKAMQDALIRAAEREYGCRAEYAELPEVPEELRRKYSSEEWRYGTRIPFSKVIEHRFDWGNVEVQMEMRGEYICSCRLYSDSLETELFGQIAELLEGCRYDAEEILGLRLAQGTSATGYEILELIASSVE